MVRHFLILENSETELSVDPRNGRRNNTTRSSLLSSTVYCLLSTINHLKSCKSHPKDILTNFYLGIQSQNSKQSFLYCLLSRTVYCLLSTIKHLKSSQIKTFWATLNQVTSLKIQNSHLSTSTVYYLGLSTVNYSKLCKSNPKDILSNFYLGKQSQKGKQSFVYCLLPSTVYCLLSPVYRQPSKVM